ncbi:MAG: hypothetical protein ACJ74Z_19975 [Bryobacteraceae bacterium]|jgi:hypothetical protein
MASEYPGKGLGLLLASGGILASGVLTMGIWYRSLAPIQAAYLPTYFKAEYLPGPSLLGMAAKPKRYTVLTVNGKDANLSTMPDTTRGVGVRYTSTTPDLFSKWLRAAVYEGQTGLELLAVPLTLWAFLSLAAIIAATVITRKKRKAAQRGERIRGPENMTVKQFNRSQGRGEKGFSLLVETVEEQSARY